MYTVEYRADIIPDYFHAPELSSSEADFKFSLTVVDPCRNT